MQPYAGQILEIIGTEPLLHNTASAEWRGYAPQPDDRPLTKCENRGIKIYPGVWNLVIKAI